MRLRIQHSKIMSIMKQLISGVLYMRAISYLAKM